MMEKRRLRSPEIDIHDKEIAIVGGGPAGAFTAILLKKKGFKHVTIYEHRSSTREKRVVQCTGCAGIIQPEVIKLLEDYDLTIPDNVIQARLTNQSQIHLPGNRNLTIRQEKGAVTVYRGFSPINQPDPKTEGFDAWLLREAINRGVVHREVEVSEIDLNRNSEGKVAITIADKK